jgi:hypothetical protein
MCILRYKVDSVSDLNPGGQLDIGDTWERYIVAAGMVIQDENFVIALAAA